MRLVAMCVAGLLLMQLPATASILSPSAREAEGPAGWNAAYGYLTWSSEHGMFRLSAGGAGAGEIAPLQLLLASHGFSGLGISDLELSSPVQATGFGNPSDYDLSLLASFTNPVGLGLEGLGLDVFDSSVMEAEETYFNNIRIAATSVCPEPATLTIWGVSALALAAATYRRQKRAGKAGKHVQAAVKEYLAACDSPSQHFRMLGSYLTRLADDPKWTKQDVEAFYDEVVVALHRRREHAEVA